MAEVKLAETLAVLDIQKAVGPTCLTNAEKRLVGQAARGTPIDLSRLHEADFEHFWDIPSFGTPGF